MNEFMLTIPFNHGIDWPSFYNFPRGRDTNESLKNVSPNRHKERRRKEREARKARRKARKAR